MAVGLFASVNASVTNCRPMDKVRSELVHLQDHQWRTLVGGGSSSADESGSRRNATCSDDYSLNQR